MKKYLHHKEVVLESGSTLPKVEVTYHTYGHLNPTGDNVVWVFHALTANSAVHHWWSELFGQERALDPEKYFIVCANVLGGCYGTTGPTSINPHTQAPYGSDFPTITIRDMVQVHRLLAQHLQIKKIEVGIGGSLGGQQLLEWAAEEPRFFDNLILLATNARHSAWGIAFNESQRMALQADPTFVVGQPGGGQLGLAAARAIALLSYRHYDTYEHTQTDSDSSKLDGYAASSYQNHQGKKLTQRFDAYSYHTLTKAMDSHHMGRTRGTLEAVLQKIDIPTLVIAIANDQLFPMKEQQYLANHLPQSEFQVIHSNYGHDGFLIETTLINQLALQFLERHIKQPNNRSAEHITV